MSNNMNNNNIEMKEEQAEGETVQVEQKRRRNQNSRSNSNTRGKSNVNFGLTIIERAKNAKKFRLPEEAAEEILSQEKFEGELEKFNKRMVVKQPPTVVLRDLVGGREHLAFVGCTYRTTAANELILCTESGATNIMLKYPKEFRRVNIKTLKASFNEKSTEITAAHENLLTSKFSFLKLDKYTQEVSVGRLSEGDRILEGYTNTAVVKMGETKKKVHIPSTREVELLKKKKEGLGNLTGVADAPMIDNNILMRIGGMMSNPDKYAQREVVNAIRVLKSVANVGHNYVWLWNNNPKDTDEYRLILMALCHIEFVKHFSAKEVPLTARNRLIFPECSEEIYEMSLPLFEGSNFIGYRNATKESIKNNPKRKVSKPKIES